MCKESRPSGRRIGGLSAFETASMASAAVNLVRTREKSQKTARKISLFKGSPVYSMVRIGRKAVEGVS